MNIIKKEAVMFLQIGLFLLGGLFFGGFSAAPALASKTAAAPPAVVATSPGKAAPAVKTTTETTVKTAAISPAAAFSPTTASGDKGAEKSDFVLTLPPPPPAPAAFPAAPDRQTTIVHQTEGAKFAPSVQAVPVHRTIWRKAHQKGYFVFHFANKFFAHEDFEFDGRSLSLGFGAQFWRNAELELYINTGRTTPSFGLKYSYPFAGEGETWIPGADASLLLGLIDERDREFRELLAAGAGAGLFLKTFVSKKYALIARGGASFSVPVSGSLWDELPKIYISLGFKRYFN